MLADGKNLEEKYLDHSLTGEYRGFRECHIEPAGYWYTVSMARILNFFFSVPVPIPIYSKCIHHALYF